MAPVRSYETGGCDPVGLGAAIGLMMSERAMVASAAGGSVLPKLAGMSPKILPSGR
ncbi:hypothetical protein [Streptomyces kronopolitis]|uniref:hypothetical protein n=1 Tax=Streptomyces kronopolitis TaxID=1612435 RepID=UPI00166F085F|nr:hypothetical protein [Streptomyces kronopolitis]